MMNFLNKIIDLDSTIKVFPLSNIYKLTQIKSQKSNINDNTPTPTPNSDKNLNQTKPPYMSARPYPRGPIDIISRSTILIPILSIVFLTEQIYPLQQYLEEAKTTDNYFWILKLALRDLAFMLMIIIGWWWFVEHYAQIYLQPKRFNQEYPEKSNLYREIPYSLSTILIGTILECIAIQLYANGQITHYYFDFFEHPYLTFVQIGLMPFWRSFHFYFAHRVMHPWFTPWYIPDIGKFLFQNSHILHHLSDNPTVWSGISMHPLEGVIYMSACVLPCIFMHHPILIWIVKIDLVLRAIIGHDGYSFPGSGDWTHYVHHVKFDCNYGSANCGMDWLFATYDDGEDLWKRMELKQEKSK